MARLEIGTTSREALQAQQALNMARRPGEPRVPEDGAYTEELANRLRDFQKRCGLQRNGQPDALTMKALALEASSEPMKYEVRYNRRLYLLSERDRNQLMARLCRALNAPTGPAGEVAAKTYAMRQFWDHHNRLNRSSPVISFLIELTATVQLGPEGRVKRCEAINAQIQAAINSRDLEAAYIALRKAEPILNSARKHFVRYRDAVDRAGGNWITALEFTKNTSFLAVGLMAGPVAASYGAGAAASGLIAGAGTAAVESIATEVGHGLAGSSQGLGTASANVLRDTLVGARWAPSPRENTPRKFSKASAPRSRDASARNGSVARGSKPRSVISASF